VLRPLGSSLLIGQCPAEQIAWWAKTGWLHQQSGSVSQTHRKIQSGEAAKVGNRCLGGLRPIGVDLFAANDLCLCFLSVRPSNE
jgi:hypothetical protein